MIDFLLAVPLIKPFARSDHDYISITLNLDNIQRGPGYWHFNSDLIADQAFVMEIEEFWSGWKNKFKEFMDPLAWWEKAKQQFKTIAIRHAKLRGKLQRHKKTQLTRKLEKLQMKSTSGVTSDIEQYLLAKEEMKQLELKELEAIKIRAKAQYHEEGEASTRYFYSLEKARRADQTIRILTKENLDTVSNTQGLLKETHNFYKALFSATPCDDAARREFLSDNIPKLSDNDRKSCEGAITEQEISKARKDMESNKSPGIDGLTANFYKRFWPLISDKLTCVFNYAFQTGHLSISQRRGVISLLFKKRRQNSA